MNKNAKALGRLAKGVKKTLSPEERRARADRMRRVGRANRRMSEKSKLRWLGKLFAAEVSDSLPFQTSKRWSATMSELEKDGLIQPMIQTLPGRFSVTIKGWQLTHAGRIMYCAMTDLFSPADMDLANEVEPRSSKPE